MYSIEELYILRKQNQMRIDKIEKEIEEIIKEKDQRIYELKQINSMIRENSRNKKEAI